MCYCDRSQTTCTQYNRMNFEEESLQKVTAYVLCRWYKPALGDGNDCVFPLKEEEVHSDCIPPYTHWDIQFMFDLFIMWAEKVFMRASLLQIAIQKDAQLKDWNLAQLSALKALDWLNWEHSNVSFGQPLGTQTALSSLKMWQFNYWVCKKEVH